ncbi:hypothetical protein HDU87_002730 [Geranomyces variabilis]|uniref:Uncharacterized protein n=1 Tax=Geranomyces variabilis TaxID=109894 RepID=A0AAD5XQZ6_9FUNG|nr:hypothetical protein HDU87_002730 [Geranomyces variabilis]
MTDPAKSSSSSVASPPSSPRLSGPAAHPSTPGRNGLGAEGGGGSPPKARSLRLNLDSARSFLEATPNADWEDYRNYVLEAAAGVAGATGVVAEQNSARVHAALTHKSVFYEVKGALAATRQVYGELAKLGWQNNLLGWETTQHDVGLTGKRPPPTDNDSSPGSLPIKRHHGAVGPPPSSRPPAMPPAVPSTLTPVRPEVDKDLPPTDTEIARVHAELEQMHQDIAGVDISKVLRNVLRPTHKKDLVEQNGGSSTACRCDWHFGAQATPFTHTRLSHTRPGFPPP